MITLYALIMLNFGGSMNISEITALNKPFYSVSQSQAIPAEKTNLSVLAAQLDKARTFVTEASKTQKPEEVQKKQTEKPKIPLTAEAVDSVKSCFPSIISPDGRYFLYRDPEDDDKTKIFDVLTKKNVGEKTLHNIENIRNQRCEQKKKRGEEPDGNEYAILGFSPDGKSLIIFSKEEKLMYKKGEIIKHAEIKLYSVTIDAGERKLLTDLSKSRNFSLQYYTEQNAVYLKELIPETPVQGLIARYPETNQLQRIKKINLDSGTTQEDRVIYERDRNDRGFADFNFSPDGNYILFSKDTLYYASCNEVYLYDIKNKKEYRVTDNNKDEKIVGWSPDSKYIIFTQCVRDNNGNAPYGLWLFDVNKKVLKQLVDGNDKFVDKDEVFISKNKDKNYLYFSAPIGFYTNLYRIDLGKINTNDAALPALELILSQKDGFVSRWNVSGDGEKIYFNADNDNATRVLSRLDISSRQKETIKNPNEGLFKKYEIPKSEIKQFSYTAENGEQVKIEYKITYPAGYNESGDKKYPLAILIHGGPNERFDAGFNTVEQPNLFATQGYITIIPNIRGSKGYGGAFLESLWSDKPNNNVSSKGREDILALIDHTIDTSSGKIDISKIGLYGFSYGGSLTEYIAAMPSKYKFKCVVSGAGNSLYSIQERALKNFWPQVDNIYLPETADSIYKTSAIAALAESIKKDPSFRTPPMLLVHGDRDNNVEFQKSKFFYDELLRLGMDVKFIVYKGAAHSGPHGKYGFISHQNYVIQWFNHFCQPEKEAYDSKTYAVYSYDGKRSLNDIDAFSTGGVGPIKKSKSGRKFAIIKFVSDSEGIFTLDVTNKSIALEDKSGKVYYAEIINRGADWEKVTDKNQKFYSSTSKEIEFAFDVPKNEKEFLLKVNGFPPIKIILKS